MTNFIESAVVPDDSIIIKFTVFSLGTLCYHQVHCIVIRCIYCVLIRYMHSVLIRYMHCVLIRCMHCVLIRCMHFVLIRFTGFSSGALCYHQVHTLLLYVLVGMFVAGAAEMRYRSSVMAALARAFFTAVQVRHVTAVQVMALQVMQVTACQACHGTAGHSCHGTAVRIVRLIKILCTPKEKWMNY